MESGKIMAQDRLPRRKPRIRKAEPTLRELAEAKQLDTETKKPQARRLGRGASRLFSPLKPAGRVVAKLLGWLAPRYFINSWREVRQVTWPNRRETWRLTLAVFIFAAVFGIIIYFVDKGLDTVFKNVVLK